MLKFFKLFLVLFILSDSIFGQKSQWYTNYSNGGLCSTSILLSNDGTYKYEHGCEASSHVSFGTWTQNKDTIKFIQVDTKDFKITKIVPSTTENAKVISVKIFDQMGKNITEKIIVKQYVKGKGYYTLTFDSSKTMRTDFKRDSGIIIIESLERLVNGSFGVQVDSFTDFEITLNIPSDLIYNIGSNWINIGNFELLKTKSTLQSVELYPADGNSKPFRIEYTKTP